MQITAGTGLAALALLVLLVALAWLAARLDGSLRLIERSRGDLDLRIDAGLREAREGHAELRSRLAVIDAAQAQLAGLAREVVGLEALLGDTRARGAFGEVQLEILLANVLPAAFYSLQHTLGNGTRVDCLLLLPEPTGRLAVDAKFPLDNYRRAVDPALTPEAREQALRQLKADLRGHVDAIAGKYIVPGETAGGAVMFLPAESLFAELHARMPEVVDYAHRRDVWIASPTTLFAILHTVAGLIRDARTRAQEGQIRDALAALALDVARFEQRLEGLARHYRQLGGDLEELHASGRRLAQRLAAAGQAGSDPAPPRES